MAIIGTINSAAFEIDLIPPNTTAATATVTIMPTSQIGKPKAECADSEIAFTCGKVPHPISAVITPKTAKIFASQVHLLPIPF